MAKGSRSETSSTTRPSATSGTTLSPRPHACSRNVETRVRGPALAGCCRLRVAVDGGEWTRFETSAPFPPSRQKDSGQKSSGNFEAEESRIIGKGNKERTVYFSHRALARV